MVLLSIETETETETETHTHTHWLATIIIYLWQVNILRMDKGESGIIFHFSSHQMPCKPA